MLAQHHRQFEIHGSAATLYVAGTLTPRQARRLRADCLALPGSVRTLRIDLRAVTTHAPEAIGAIARMVRDWRAERRGRCCLALASAHFVVGDRREEGSLLRAAGAAADRTSTDALMGTYL